MFENRRRDRRSGYSFRAHFRRIVETKGFGRIALSLGATAIIAGTAFANCSGSDITGPADPSSAATPGVGTQASTTVKSPAPFRIPMPLLPTNNPCNGDGPIIWDHGSTMIQGTTQVSSSLDGRFHAQFHLNAQGQGTSPTRRYTGGQEYNSQTFTFLLGDNNKFKFEWNVRLIAKGEDGTLFPEDDFHLHIVQTMGAAPDFIPEVTEVTAPPGECK
jgi:hypothetical protein